MYLLDLLGDHVEASVKMVLLLPTLPSQSVTLKGYRNQFQNILKSNVYLFGSLFKDDEQGLQMAAYV